jgi:hypothetical protein
LTALDAGKELVLFQQNRIWDRGNVELQTIASFPTEQFDLHPVFNLDPFFGVTNNLFGRNDAWKVVVVDFFTKVVVVIVIIVIIDAVAVSATCIL